MPESPNAWETLFRNLSQGMHAVAQPLAVLRASFGNSYVDRMSGDELRELAASSALEIERACRLFSCLQQMVSAESTRANLSAVPVLPLLAHVVDGVKLLFDEGGVFLRTVTPESCPAVRIDRERTLEALSSVLLVAHAVSRAQETVELVASLPSAGMVRIEVRNAQSEAAAMEAEQRLGMALAETNIRSEQGSLAWSLQPFRVQIELQRAELKELEAGLDL